MLLLLLVLFRVYGGLYYVTLLKEVGYEYYGATLDDILRGCYVVMS